MKKIIKEIKPTIELSAAIIIGIFVIPLGVIWAFWKPFYDIFKRKRTFSEIITRFLRYWINIVIQILRVVIFFLNRIIIMLKMTLFEFRPWATFKYLEHSLALTIDIFGNVSSGELIEDIVTPHEQTLYGDGRYTISAATGYLEVKGWLNETGIWFTNALSYCFEENHSVNAWNHEKDRVLCIQ